MGDDYIITNDLIWLHCNCDNIAIPWFIYNLSKLFDTIFCYYSDSLQKKYNWIYALDQTSNTSELFETSTTWVDSSNI